MGALVTLDLPDDSSVLGLPWIITFGPLGDEDEWEPVVCGPYERGHALALAEAVVADEELMAVVEPLLPAASVDAVRAEIANARRLATEETDEVEAADLYGDYTDVLAEQEPTEEERHARPLVVPSEAELRAGFNRIAEMLTGKETPRSSPAPLETPD
ncbi:hypothetical protein [Micromonospora echinofusca]|uniref:Uncharacterized protein n=1 Tax=Micromonospora echinofusca TaxID=47858 RepID=A0ABS3VLZ6_MICEH|nr:hypothetical protein [Micromonospora echinofusca]MBO4205537.1 hypothetical protein [Micromonospora echinofusca]